MLALNKITLTNKILYSTNIVVGICIIFFCSGILLKVEKPMLPKKRDFIKEYEMKPIKPYSYYAKLIAKRSLFIPIVEELPTSEPQPFSQVLILPQPQVYPKLQEPSEPPPPPPKPKIPLEQRISNLILIGVISDKEGKTAIIQDRRYNKEYFLKKGDTIQEVKIEDVLEDKVILKDGDEIVELRM